MRNYDFKVTVIIPVFNEEGCVAPVAERVVSILSDYSEYEVLFIDDGSHDSTLETLKKLHTENPKINFLSFSRNFGQQNALRAGTRFATGNCIISLDGDLQHPPELIPDLISK